ncbi:MAG: hypothetical protein IKY42_01700 [Bacteroidaceae bacterium]|nr:hypothetical protein [Bacteroidaceae bacterium]
MKKLLCIVLLSVGISSISAQTDSTMISSEGSTISRIDSLLQETNAWLEHIELNLSLKQRYKLYPTENMYNFLKLDTKTGRIEQVQWSLDRDKEFISVINNDDLTYGYGHGSGSFELYPTQNMYQFLLIDKTSGRAWHVQWGLSSSNRWIRRIY